MPVDLGVIIISYNTRDLLMEALESVMDTAGHLGVDVWVVDNGSADGSVDAVRQRFPSVNIIENSENRGFAAANNQALAHVEGEFILLLNSDARLTTGAVDELLGFMRAHPTAGMACGQLLNLDGSRQNSFAPFPDLLTLMVNESLLRRLWPSRYPGKNTPFTGPTRIDSCIGACMLVRKSAMDAVGVFDERYFFFMEETDWARRFRQHGWEVYFVPTARIIHAQGRSAGSSAAARIMFYRSRYQYLNKWHPRWSGVMKTVLVIRLTINIVLNLIGNGVTLGASAPMRHRLSRYVRILMWHMRGCP